MTKQTKIRVVCKNCNGYKCVRDEYFPEELIDCPVCRGIGYKEIDFTDVISFRYAMLKDANNYMFDDDYRDKAKATAEGIDLILKLLNII